MFCLIGLMEKINKYLYNIIKDKEGDNAYENESNEC